MGKKHVSLAHLITLQENAEKAYKGVLKERGDILKMPNPGHWDTFAEDVSYLVYDLESLCAAIMLQLERGKEITPLQYEFATNAQYYEREEFKTWIERSKEDWPNITRYTLAVQELYQATLDLITK